MALARMAGVAERLKGQVRMKAARAQDLERRILANHPAGNMELAGSLARELQELKADLTDRHEELKETEEAYQANLRQAKLAQREFEDKVRKLEKQLSQVQIKEAQAEAAGALGNAAFKVGDLGDTMKDVEDILQKRYEVSAGKARVAKDMVDMDTVAEKENERKALEQIALAEFLAQPGHPGGARAGAVHAGDRRRSDLSNERTAAASFHAARQVDLDPADRRPDRARRLHDSRRPLQASGDGSPAAGSSGAAPAARAGSAGGEGRSAEAVAAGAVHARRTTRPDRDQRVRRLRRADRRQRRPRAERELAVLQEPRLQGEADGQRGRELVAS